MAAKKSPPPLMALVEIMLGDAARNLALYPWRPHRAFSSKPERLRATTSA
jgi:hypothetical protein